MTEQLPPQPHSAPAPVVRRRRHHPAARGRVAAAALAVGAMGGMVGWLAGTATDAGTSTDATTTSRSGTAASDTPTTTTQPTTDEGFGRSGAVPGGSTDGWSGGTASSTGPSTATHGS